MDNEPVSQPLPANSPPVKTMGKKTGALIILLVGLFGLIGGYLIMRSSAIPKSYVTTHGQVKSSSPAQGGNYDLLIDFTAQDNKQYSFTSRVPAESAKHNSNYFVGENTVKVAYNPQNPGVGAKNASDKATPAYGIIFEIIGGLFAIIGLVSLVQQLLTRG